MRKIIIRTYPFADKFAQKELSTYTKREIKNFTKKGEFIIAFDGKDEVKSKLEIIHFLTQILYYSRLIKKVFLLDETGEEIDLFDFDLNKREYKINKETKGIILDPILVNYCLYLLEINNIVTQNWSIIDPISSLGDIIIESSIFNPRCALNVRKRLKLPLTKIFQEVPKIPSKVIDKNKYIGIVQDNTTFKKLKENISYLDTKIKMSQYELDWLDVKFKKEAINYVFSYFGEFDEKQEFLEFQKKYFYQAEFICSNKICIISLEEISENILKELGLKVEKKELVEIDKEKFFIYVIGK